MSTTATVWVESRPFSTGTGTPSPDFSSSFKLGETTQVGLISYQTRLVFELVNFVIVCGIISLIGIVSNIINITVFIKQGFRDSINISLCGLAVADFMCLLTMFWNSICYNPLFVNADVPFNSLELMYLSGGWPHACFNRVTSFITAFITLERCLCIIHPLKVKTILTPGRTKVIIVSIFVVMLLLFSPFYYANRLQWLFDPKLSRTRLTLTFTTDREVIETSTFFVNSVALVIISLLIVIVCTILLIIKLNQKSKWRQATVSQQKSETASVKDKRVVKMVTFISTIFTVCFVPAAIIFFMMAYEPEFSFQGRFRHICFSVWSVAFVLETVSSSVNIVIYYKMSSKYRQTFLHIFFGLSDTAKRDN